MQHFLQQFKASQEADIGTAAFTQSLHAVPGCRQKGHGQAMHGQPHDVSPQCCVRQCAVFQSMKLIASQTIYCSRC
jgi:hypothetical protein